MSEALLPNSAGPTTRALAYTFDTYSRFSPYIATVNAIGVTSTPDAWVPWFVYDLGLEGIIPYVKTLRQALEEGPTWQARRGTPDGIRIGIGWVTSEGTVAPPDQRHNWWEFQVRLAEPIHDVDQLKRLAGIIALSAAAEDELFRLFNDAHDYRPARGDMHQADVGSMYDDYSGAILWDGGPLISFGTDEVIEIGIDPIFYGGTDLSTFGEAELFDGLRYDVGAQDLDAIYGPWSYSSETDGSGGEIQTSGQWPVGGYPAGGDWSAGDSIGWIELEEGRVDDDTIDLTDRADVWPITYRVGTWKEARQIQSAETPWETS